MRKKLAKTWFPIHYALQFSIVILSTWAREGFAVTDNLIELKNKLFMHEPTFIEELYQTDQVTTSSGTFSRADLEAGAIPIEIIKTSRFAPQELNRLAQEEIQAREEEQGVSFSNLEKQTIKKNIYDEKANTVDTQVMQGIAMMVINSDVSTVTKLFLNLNAFHRYVPDVFLKSTQLTPEELSTRRVVKLDNTEFQYSEVQISWVKFSHTLRYEMSHDDTQAPSVTVAWEIDPRFQSDSVYGQKGVLINSGMFKIHPYGPNRSIIIYQAYIKIDPMNIIMETFSELFKDSKCRSVMLSLAEAVRKEVHY